MSNLSTPVRRPQGTLVQPRSAAALMGGWLALLWLLDVADQLTLGYLDQFGIRPRDFGSLYAIVTAPFLHFGFSHLIANSLPFLALGFLVLLSGRRQFWLSTSIVVISSGMTVWLFAAPGSITVGASGLIFGWLSYLLLRGVFARNWLQILEAVVIFAVYGSILMGVLPGQAGVSWQGHLGGATGGVLAAIILGRGKPGLITRTT